MASASRKFIYSLPRSGSAWLSLFLSGPESFFFHEPLVEKQHLFTLFERPYRVVGGVDTSAYQTPARVVRELPGASLYALRRDLNGIRSSSEAMGFGSINFEEEERRFLCATDGLPVIKYELLSDVDYLAWVWNALVGGDFDRVRALQMIEMRVERDLQMVTRKYFA